MSNEKRVLSNDNEETKQNPSSNKKSGFIKESLPNDDKSLDLSQSATQEQKKTKEKESLNKNIPKLPVESIEISLKDGKVSKSQRTPNKEEPKIQ